MGSSGADDIYPVPISANTVKIQVKPVPHPN